MSNSSKRKKNKRGRDSISPMMMNTKKTKVMESDKCNNESNGTQVNQSGGKDEGNQDYNSNLIRTNELYTPKGTSNVITKKTLFTQENCEVCLSIIEEENRTIKCDQYEKNYHILCVDISVREMRFIEELRSKIKWFCNSCSDICSKNKKDRKTHKDKPIVSEANAESNMGKKDSGNTEVLQKFNEKFEEIRKDLLFKVEDFNRKIDSGLEEKLRKCMEDMKIQLGSSNLSKPTNTEDRKNNLVLFNINEPPQDDPHERKKYDLMRVHEVFERGVQAENYNIVNVIRLGKRESLKAGENRPILVKLASSAEKWAIMKQAKNLKNSPNGMHRVSIPS